MNIIIAAYLFIVGLAFGSFALAMVDRMKTKRDWVKGRSECEYCDHKLMPIDLVPVLSWLSTGGKCRYCHKKLPAVYPVTEVGVGFAFLISYVYWPYEFTDILSVLQFVVWLIAIVTLTGLFIFDVRWFLLPNKLIRPLIALGVVWMAMDILNQGLSFSIILDYILAIIVSAGVFLALYVVSKGKWIGDGDIRLGVAIGLFTGSPMEAWMTVFIASVIGIIAAIPLIRKTKKRKRLKMKIPFGPVLIIALYITVLFGTQIVDWYRINILYL